MQEWITAASVPLILLSIVLLRVPLDVINKINGTLAAVIHSCMKHPCSEKKIMSNPLKFEIMNDYDRSVNLENPRSAHLNGDRLYVLYSFESHSM
jgi:hypothetical protein